MSNTKSKRLIVHQNDETSVAISLGKVDLAWLVGDDKVQIGVDGLDTFYEPEEVEQLYKVLKRFLRFAHRDHKAQWPYKDPSRAK